MRQLIVVGMFAVLLSACSKNPLSPGGGGAANMAGTWSGTIEDNLHATGTIRMTVYQSDTSLSGTWSSKFRGKDVVGTMNGTVSGSNVTLLFGYPADPCINYQLESSMNGSTLKGSYVGLAVVAGSCNGSVAGTMNFAKQ